VLVTDKLRNYAAAKREIMPGVEHRQHKGLNNRAENSHPQAKRQRRRNTQWSDSAVNGRSRSSVTADRKVELTAAVSLAATTGGLFFLADDGQ
jgi:transposase-like protein